MNEMNLSERMRIWGELQLKVDNLAKEIKAEVMALGRTQNVGSVTASYSIGKGKYDYKAMARKLEPDQDIIDRNTEMVTAWRSVCNESGITDDVKVQFYTPGKPYVGLKLMAS